MILAQNKGRYQIAKHNGRYWYRKIDGAHDVEEMIIVDLATRLLNAKRPVWEIVEALKVAQFEVSQKE